jgi:hypothetical protein
LIMWSILEDQMGSIPKVVCELEKDRIYYLKFVFFSFFTSPKKRTRAEKLRYGVPWFRGASRIEGKVIGKMLYGRLPRPIWKPLDLLLK